MKIFFRRRYRKTRRYLKLFFRYLPFYYKAKPSPYCQDKNIFAKYLQGKRVVIVGPAPGIIGSGQGELIDAFDIVVRINHVFPLPDELKNDMGTKTDILYHNFWLDSPNALPPEEMVPLLVNNIEWLCCAYPYLNFGYDHVKAVDRYNSLIKNQIKFRTIDPRNYLLNSFRLKTRLNAGFSAIQDLLLFDFKELYITGFTFYQTSKTSYDGYRGIRSNDKVHNQRAQMRQMRKWVKEDSRIKVDDILQNILFKKKSLKR